MKMELIDRVMQRMMSVLDEKQLQELRMALVISMEGLTVEKEKTELSTEVIDNWEYVRRFLQAFLMSGKSQETVKQYQLHLRIMLNDLRKPVWEITESDIMEHLARQKYSRKLSNRYLNYKRAVFGSFFSWLRRKRYIRENPVELIEPIKYESVIKKPFTDEEREKLRCACQHERDLAILDFLYSTAARVSEMTALNRQDIDLVGGECIVHGKGGKERPVYLNASAAYHLQRYLEERTDSNPALFVSYSQPYNRLNKDGVEALLRRIGIQTGIEKVHPHRYRRTAITNAANRGMPLQDAQVMAGHADANTTMVYFSSDKSKVKSEHKMYLAS